MFLKAFFLSLLFALFFNVCRADIYLRVDENGQLHAKLEGVPLSEVRIVLEQGYGISFSGDDAIYKTPLTVTFQNLSLEKALHRIFSHLNFVVVYNSEGIITEVSVFPSNGNMITFKKTSDQPEKLSNNFVEIYAKKAAAKQTLDHLGANNSAAGKVVIMAPKTMLVPSKEKGFQVVPNSPPGRIGAIYPGSIPSGDVFEVIPNSPPSGTSFQIVPSAPPARK